MFFWLWKLSLLFLHCHAALSIPTYSTLQAHSCSPIAVKKRKRQKKQKTKKKSPTKADESGCREVGKSERYITKSLITKYLWEGIFLPDMQKKTPDNCETPLCYSMRLNEDILALQTNLIFHLEVSWFHLFNYINKVRANEGHVEDNVMPLAVSTSNYWGCTAQLTARRKQGIVNSQHLLSEQAIHYFLPLNAM